MTEIHAVTLQESNTGARRAAVLEEKGVLGRHRDRLVLACALTAAASSCGGAGDVVEIEKTRIAAVPSKTALAGVDLRSRLRMGGASQQAPAPTQPSPTDLADLFEYDVPKGWDVLEPTQFRLVNLRCSAVPMAEITLTVLGGNGGGLKANIDRWRAQVGLEPSSQAEVTSYPTRPLIGNEATYVEFNGPYQGMGGPKIEDGALYGAIISRGGQTLFVKMTGPRGTLESERDSFNAFMDSLGVKPPTGGPQPGAQAPSAQGPSAQGSSAQGSSAMGAEAGASRPSPLVWDAPQGWSEELAPSPFREVTFRSGDVEMYISLARGGALANINRWAGQLGLAPLDEAGLAALPRASMLGREAIVFEGEGSLKGMRDPAPKPDQRMLAALVEDGGLIITVKTTGPSADVDAARDDFYALIASIANR